LAAVSATSTSVSGDSMDVLTQSQFAATSHIVPTTIVNQGVQPPGAGPTQTPLQGQFQFHSPWFPSGQSHSAMHASPGFILSPNSSAPLLNNPVHSSSSPLNPSNMPSLFGPRPIPAAGLNSFLQNPHFLPRPQPPTHVLQHPYMAQPRPLGHTGPLRNPPMTSLQPSSAQPNFSAPPPFTGSQPPPTRPAPIIMGSLMSSLPQPMSGIPPRSIPDRPWTPAGSSSVWSGAPASASASASLGLSNMGQMAPQMVPHNRPHPQNPLPGVASVAPPSNISTASLVSPVIFSSRPSPTQLSGAAVNRPIGAPHFVSNPPPQGGHPAAFSASLHQTSALVPSPKSSVNLVLGSAPIPLHGSSTQSPLPLQSGVPNSVSGSSPNFTPIKPPTMSAPSSCDFTFQPHRPQNPVSQMVPTPSRQPAIQSTPQVQPPARQVPSFQLGVPKITQPVNQVFQRPQFSNSVGQPQAPVSAAPYAQTPTGAHRLAAFPNASVAPRTPLPQMSPRSFSPAPQMPSLPGPMVPRPGNPLQLQQNYPARTTRPDIHLAPNQQFGNTFSFASSKPPSNSGGQQIYDPFSPTSVPTSKADG
jgi:splicing factor 1